MDENKAKKIIKSICNERMKQIGLKPNSSKSKWIEDCGYYAIVVSLYPQKGFGFAFIVAVHFLWNESQNITFDYWRGDSIFLQVPGTQGIGDSLLYDDPYLEEHLERILTKAEIEIEYFRTVKEYDKMLLELQKKEYNSITWPSIYENISCIRFILSETQKARDTFHYLQERCSNMYVKDRMRKYSALLNCEEEFLLFLNNNIESNRNQLRKKFPNSFFGQYILIRQIQ